MAESPRKTLIYSYSVAPRLLELRLYQIFRQLENPEQVAVHNDIMDDINVMVGEGLEGLVEKVAQEVINVGKAELVKEKK